MKRRVYDALNVLYAAGVLNKKDSKQVYCAPKLSTNFSLDEIDEDQIQNDVSPYDEALRSEIIKHQCMIQH